MARWIQLEEMTEGREPKIWLVNATAENDKLTFELGYLGNGYGGSSCVFVPVGGTLPQIKVSIPKQVMNLENGVVLASGGFFTIESISE